MNQSGGSSVQTEIFPPENISTKYTKRHTDIMLGCFVVGEDKAFIIETDRIKTISQLRDAIKAYKENVFKTSDANQITLWKVNIPIMKKWEINTDTNIAQKFGAVELKEEFDTIEEHFGTNPTAKHIHVIVYPPPPATTAKVYKTTEEVLRDAESHWTKLKDKLVKKIELEEFKVSDHIYKDNINASRIPVIKGSPSFVLHSLPDSDNEEGGYVPENVLTNLIKYVMKYRWLFLMGTSGSGKTRSSYELLCKTYGIYFSLNTGNGSKNNNLGSRDMDITIEDLGFKLVPNKPQENNNIALLYTRAMLLSRLFILTKLLEFHKSSNSTNFTPKQWLLMQLLPLQIHDEDFWIFIARDFRNLEPLHQDELVCKFIEEFQSLVVPEQKKLPIVIDESQSTIEKFEKMFPSTKPGNQLRPFFVILLRSVLNLATTKLCLILSGTGMSFEDIENFASSTIAKQNGPSFGDFFFLHDGFYENSEMSNYIRRFLPLNDESIENIFNIFRGRRRFLVRFLNTSLLDTSSMSRDVNENVDKWQREAKDLIIRSFKKTCFPRLREDKEVWNKVMDIVILSMFSNSTMVVRGEGVVKMVQYGFAQLCDYKHLASGEDPFKEDVIEVQIQETIPFLAFREYIEKDCRNRNEIEEKILQNLCSVHYNASCAGFYFESYLPIVLVSLFHEKICKEHPLFTNIKGIDQLKLLSHKATIRNKDSPILCSKGDMKEFNLHGYLDDPNTAFFMPEKDAGPDLVCIIEFETPDETVEVPLFLQAKLWKNSPGRGATASIDPNSFYHHGDGTSIPESKIELKEKVIDCLRTKYRKAHNHYLSWIRFLVVYPAKFSEKSYYKRNFLPERLATNNYLRANELLIVVDYSNARHFFSTLGINVLDQVKRVEKRINDKEIRYMEVDEKETDMGVDEKETDMEIDEQEINME